MPEAQAPALDAPATEEFAAERLEPGRGRAPLFRRREMKARPFVGSTPREPREEQPDRVFANFRAVQLSADERDEIPKWQREPRRLRRREVAVEFEEQPD